MDEDDETKDCVPISTETNQGLEVSEVVDYLNKAATTYKEYLNHTVNPPVQPKMTLLNQKIRRKNKEKPSGRKCPRKKISIVYPRAWQLVS